MYNLIDERWIPVIRKSGAISMIAPWEISDSADPPLKVRFTRQDMNSAVTQFLIGLIQTVMVPVDESDWLDLLEGRPTPDDLKKRMSSIRDAFELIGETHPFMQESGIDGPRAIDSLIITSPGENTLKLNKDFFIKRNGGESCLCLSCTAAAVYAMQALAPVGGSGYSCSIRGSSPLTTMLEGEDLFSTVFLNVLSKNNLVGDTKDLIFPWMSDERSDALYSSENDPRMVYWTTVRRLKLRDVTQGKCMLCGAEGDVVSRYDTVKKGTAFKDWIHPLCPYLSDKTRLVPIMVKENIGHFDQWTYMIYDISSDTTQAKVVSQLKRNRNDVSDILGKNQVRLWISGYINDKALVKGWKEIRQPILMEYDHRIELLITNTIKELIGLTDYGLKQLVSSINILQGSRDPGKKSQSSKMPSDLRERFWSECDSIFPATVKRAASEDIQIILTDWGSSIRRIALSIFEDYSDSFPLEYYQNIARGRRFLQTRLSDKSIQKELSK